MPGQISSAYVSVASRVARRMYVDGWRAQTAVADQGAEKDLEPIAAARARPEWLP